MVAAGEHGKPVVLLPRRARLGEQRNDHQLGTVHWLRARPGVHVAEDETALPARIAAARGTGAGAVPAAAPPAFLDRLRSFVLD